MSKPGTVSGFSSYSTARYEGFSAQVCSEWGRIISAFTQHRKTQEILDFFQDLEKHLRHFPGAHDLNLDPWKKELLSQLYIAYREAGNTGSKEEMLLSFFKDVEVATMDEAIHGNSAEKAITAKEFDVFFKHHLGFLGHPVINSILQPNTAYRPDPVFSINSLIGKKGFWKTEKMMAFPWNPYEGTLFLKLHYQLKENETLPLFDILNSGIRINFQLHREEGKTYFEIRCHSATEYAANYEIIPSDVDKIVISYSEEKLVIQDALHKDAESPSFLNIHADALILHTNVGNQPNAISELVYYPQLVYEYCRLFLLNEGGPWV